MATVPVALPTVDMQAGNMPAFNAPEVKGMENFQPKQMVESGKALMESGARVTKVGEKIQDEIDDAQTKKGDAWFLQNAQKILTDKDGGYLFTQGERAQAEYGQTIEKLDGLRKQAESFLTNDTQRAMFNRVADRHMLTFGSQISNHAVREVRTFGVKESEAREAGYISAAIATASTRDSIPDENMGEPSGAFNMYLKTASQEAEQRADLLGLPPDSAQRRAMVMGATGQIHAGVITNLVLDNKYVEAKKWLDRAVDENEISIKQAQQLGVQIETGYRKQVGTQAGERIYSQRAPDGSDFDTAVSWVMAQEGGYVENDAGKGPTNFGINSAANPGVDIKNLTPEKAKQIYRKQYWDAIDADKLPPEIRAIAFDTAVNQGVATAKRLIKEAGNDPQKLIDLRRAEYQRLVDSNPEKFGKFEKGWMARLDKLESGITGERTLSSMIAEADQIADPEERQIAKATIKARYSEEESVRKADYNDKLTKATDIAFAKPGGWQDIPAPMWSSLKQADRARLMEMPRGDDPNTVIMLDNNPRLWVKGKIEQYRPLLSEARYQRYYNAGNGVDGQGKILEASIDSDQFNNALNKAGLQNLVEAKKGDKAQREYIDLRDKFQMVIEAEQQARGRKLSLEEKGKLLQMLIKPVKVKAVQNILGFERKTDMDVRAFQVQNRGNIIIPDEIRTRITNDMRARGIPVTEDRITNAYLMMAESK